MTQQQLNDYRIAEADYHRTRHHPQVFRWRRIKRMGLLEVMTRYEHDPLSKYLIACEILGIDPVTQEKKA